MIQRRSRTESFGRAWLRPVLLLGVLGSVSCSEYGYTEKIQIDTFRQNRLNAVDLLVVIDNSCSMVEEQGNLARNFDALISTFSGAEVDWQVAVTTTDVEVERYRGLLIAGDDEIIMRGPNGEIDRVTYDREWPFTAGTSLQLSTHKHSWVSNDSPENWCASTDAYADSYGTPGTANVSCTGDQPDPPELDGDQGPVTPSTGDLLITEIMAWSVEEDARCEWFELTNTTDDTLDLDGISFSDMGNNYADLPNGVQVPPQGHLVIGRSLGDTCGTPVDISLENGFSLNHDVRVITPADPNGRELFVENVAQGTIGTGIEMGLEGARLVFEEPYFTDQNQGFLRDYANLAILFVTDEDDVSPYPVDAYLRYFSDLKGDDGYRIPGRVTLSSVVGTEPTARNDIPSCTSPNGEAYYGRRYLEASTQTGGLVESICEEDFAPIVSKLGLTLTGLVTTFELSGIPRLETLTVTLYADETEESKIGDLVRDVDYTYEIEDNLLRFADDQLPASETYIVAEYEVLPTGSVLDQGE